MTVISSANITKRESDIVYLLLEVPVNSVTAKRKCKPEFDQDS